MRTGEQTVRLTDNQKEEKAGERQLNRQWKRLAGIHNDSKRVKKRLGKTFVRFKNDQEKHS